MTAKPKNVQSDKRDTNGEIVVIPNGVTLRGSIGTAILRILQEGRMLSGSSCGGHEWQLRGVQDPLCWRGSSVPAAADQAPLTLSNF